MGPGFKIGDRVVTMCSNRAHNGRHGRVIRAHSGTDPFELDIALDGEPAGGICSTYAHVVLAEEDGPPEPPSMLPPERSAILADADKLINGQRQVDYGPPAVNFQRIATMWSVLFPERKWTPGDVARAMAAVKLARTAQGFTRDTAVDLAGYAALYGELGGEK